eukprot:40184_1
MFLTFRNNRSVHFQISRNQKKEKQYYYARDNTNTMLWDLDEGKPYQPKRQITLREICDAIEREMDRVEVEDVLSDDEDEVLATKLHPSKGESWMQPIKGI